MAFFTEKEFLKGTNASKVPQEHLDNLETLISKLSVVRKKWDKAMLITSGYRTMEDHLRIYRQKGITDKAKIPMQSNHLKGLAVDISDPKRELQAFLLKNVALLEEQGLYCEDFDHTSTWVHFQCVPPKSGNRFFKP